MLTERQNKTQNTETRKEARSAGSSDHTRVGRSLQMDFWELKIRPFWKGRQLAGAVFASGT